MEKSRKTKIISAVILVALVVVLSVVYAALSSSLLVRGTTRIATGTWDIRFVNNKPTTPTVSPQRTTGSSSDNTVVVSNDGLTLTYAANLKIPGDTVTYTAKIHNYGTIDGEITGITNKLVDNQGVELSSESAVKQKADRILNVDIHYTNDNKIPSVGDVIKANNEDEITIIVSYNRDIANADLPSSDETYLYEYKITYGQSDTQSATNTHTAESSIVEPSNSYQEPNVYYNVTFNELANVDWDTLRTKYGNEIYIPLEDASGNVNKAIAINFGGAGGDTISYVPDIENSAPGVISWINPTSSDPNNADPSQIRYKWFDGASNYEEITAPTISSVKLPDGYSSAVSTGNYLTIAEIEQIVTFTRID